MLSNKKNKKSDQTVLEPTIRLVKLKPHGWVLVSGDDVAEPVLGYSFEDTFDEKNIPVQLQDMINVWSQEIAEARDRQDINATFKTMFRWHRYNVPLVMTKIA